MEHLDSFSSFPPTEPATIMIIVLKTNASEEQIQHICDRIEKMDLMAHLSRGTFRTVIGVIGDEAKAQVAPLEALPGVDQVVAIMKPYKLASLDAHPQPSVVDVSGVKVGGGNLAMIAGPCAVEEEERMDRIAAAIVDAGANILRGGAFKPRTSPYAFQGMGKEGLRILRDVGQRHNIPVVTEVMDPRDVELVAEYADLLQIGARNMQNFSLLKEVGDSTRPVLLKRGMSATVQDLLMCAEYILSKGNSQVILCERGLRGFDSYTRNLYDVACVPIVKELSHLPIIVDPSHATGKPSLIPPCALAGIAAGADGVHIEVHDCPEEALSDGPQSLLPSQYEEVMQQMQGLAQLLGKQISPLAGAISS
ncbi:2-keto-3-deoxy-D-arabino-heptulosonate-7-phosphate synthase I beta [Planctomycetales bacterium 10988]|nr:2-keto-3-deoxy-D-arabino-heptulosonate-7-phosphate synthase I beta [Planctomycetales bacterium 10988]